MAEALATIEARGDGYGRAAVAEEVMNRIAARRRELSHAEGPTKATATGSATRVETRGDQGRVGGSGRPAISAEVRAMLASSNDGGVGRAANAQLVGRLVEAIRALERAG